jgi:hypothetical protein
MRMHFFDIEKSHVNEYLLTPQPSQICWKIELSHFLYHITVNSHALFSDL